MKLDKGVNWSSVLSVVVISMVLAVVFDLSPEWKLNTQEKGAINMSYPDLAAILLTAVGVLVTVFGVGIAILSIWGYRHFKDAAISAAQEQVRDSIADEKSVLHKVLKEEAVKTVENIKSHFSQGIDTAKQWGNENSEYGE